jgi:hypothetical protein
MRTGEANASDTGNGPDISQQIGEQRSRRHVVSGPPSFQLDVATVTVDVLAEQSDLGDALGRQTPNFVQHVVVWPTDLGTANAGNDAERAGVVASDLNGHPRVVTGGPLGRQRRWEQGLVIENGFVQDLGDRAPGHRIVQQIDGAMNVVGAQHDVHPWCAVANDLAVLLGQTTRHHDLTALTFVLPTPHGAQGAVQLVVGVLANAAGVEHHDVRIVLVLHRAQSVTLEQPGNALGVVLVHLTPEGANDVGPCRGLGHGE